LKEGSLVEELVVGFFQYKAFRVYRFMLKGVGFWVPGFEIRVLVRGVGSKVSDVGPLPTPAPPPLHHRHATAVWLSSPRRPRARARRRPAALVAAMRPRWRGAFFASACVKRPWNWLWARGFRVQRLGLELRLRVSTLLLCTDLMGFKGQGWGVEDWRLGMTLCGAKKYDSLLNDLFEQRFFLRVSEERHLPIGELITQ